MSKEAEGASFGIVINPGWDATPRVRPRKGTFEVRVVKPDTDPEVMISLTSMPRPFKKLRELDLSDLATRVATSLKSDCKASSEAVDEDEADAEATEEKK